MKLLRRQFQFRVGAGNFCSVHVSLVPVLGVVGEQKTKPTQHSVAVLRSLGINPHLLACRSSEPLEQSVKVKLVSTVSQQTQPGHFPLSMQRLGCVCNPISESALHTAKILDTAILQVLMLHAPRDLERILLNPVCEVAA